MYTLKINIINKETQQEFIHTLQALAQEAPAGIYYEFETGAFYTSVTLETVNIKAIKRLVDIIESEEFMREQN